MAQVSGGPTLHVRDARTVSNRDEIRELRTFFDLGPVIPPSEALDSAKSTKKLSKSRSLFGIGKRDQPGQIDSVKVPKGAEKPLPQPEGTVARKLGCHTVYMLGAANQSSYTTKSATLPSRPAPLSQQTRSVSYSHYPLSVPTLRRPSFLKTRSDTNVQTSPRELFLKGAISASQSSDNETTVSNLSNDVLANDSLSLRSPVNSYSSLRPVKENSPPSRESRSQDGSLQMDSRNPKKIFKDAYVQTDDTEEGGTEALVQQVIVVSGPDEETKDMLLPLTPPPSSTSIGAHVESPTNSIPSQSISQRRRRRRKRTTRAPIDYNMSHNHFEILDLELMEDKDQAFEQLLGIYKQHKFLRDAEDELHQQQLKDISAGLVAQKMVNLKLMDMLKEGGVSMQEIRSAIGACIDVNLSSSDVVLSPKNSPDLSDVDAARFHLLRKDQQFDRIRDFQASGSNRSQAISSPISDKDTLDVRPRFKALEELPTPVPTQPLPPVPQHRSSMFVPRSSMMVSPVVRSKSLTENLNHSIDADGIDERMRRLERVFNFSHGMKANTSTHSAKFSPSKQTELDSLLEEDSSEPASDSHGPFKLCTADSRANRGDSPTSCASSYSDSDNAGLNVHSSSAPFLPLKSGESSSVSLFNNLDSTSFTSSTRQVHPHHQVLSASRDNPTSPNPSGSSRPRRGSLPNSTPSLANKSPTNSKSSSIDEATWSVLLLGLIKGPDRNSSTPI